MLASAHPILVINNGSSSLKFSVLDPKSETLLSSGLAERIGTEQGSLKMTDLDQEKHQEKLALADHRAALLRVIEILSGKGRFECKAIGHRVAHGGEYFREPVLVTDSVLHKIEELGALAPLHNPANALGVRVAADIFPGKPQVAVFDTAFHQTLPPYAFHYAIPYELYEKYRVRRYGFHGTSHHYVTMEAARRLGKPYENGKQSDGRITTGFGPALPSNTDKRRAHDCARNRSPDPMKHAFFLAPSGTGVGLTTVSLGLFNALDSHGVPVAYFKPISQGTESTSGLDRSTHFIRTTTMLQPADPMPAKTANRMISEGRLDEFLGHVIAAFAMAALSKVPLAGLILTGDVAIDERISVGPMLQGLRRPVNDLSRGALVDDIVYTIALTAIQATQT